MDRPTRPVRRASIGVESMEVRVVLSTVGTSMIATLRGAPAHGIVELDLQGTAHGSASRVVGNPDIGTAVMIQGSAQVADLGTMRVSGAFHGTGLIAKGGLMGTLTLSGARGTLTLQLQGPSVPGFTGPASGSYRFTIPKGTGSLAHDFGGGSVDVVLGPRAFSLAFHGTSPVD